MATNLSNSASKIIQQQKEIYNKTTTAAQKATNTIQKTVPKVNIEDFMVGGGFGGGINQSSNDITQTKPTTSASSGNLQRAVESSAPMQRIDQDIFGNKTNYVNTLVDEMFDATISKKIRDEIRKGNLTLKTSGLGKTYATAVAYYKKLFDGSIIMTKLRNKTEKNISKLINQSINDKVASWQKKLPNWQKMLLAKSKLMSSITNSVNATIKNAIGGILNNKAIVGLNDTLLKNLKKINESINTTINTKFKKQIEEALKLKSIVEEKIRTFIKLKEEFTKKIANALNALKKKIAEVLTSFTKKLVGTLTDSVKTMFSKNTTGAAKA